MAISLALASAFFGIVYYWARGAMLWGADNFGIYAAGDFWLYPRPDYLIPSFFAWIFPQTPWEILYASIFVDAFVSSYACQFFARQLFRRTYQGRTLLALGAIASGLYFVSPVAISYWYVGLLTNIALSTSAFFVALGLLVMLLKSYSGGRAFSWKDAGLLGLALGFAAPDSIPNEVRLIGMCLVLFGAAFAFGLVFCRNYPEQRRASYASTLRVLVLALPIALAFYFYPFYSFATSPGFNLHSVGGVATSYSVRFLNNTSFNTIGVTPRLLGRVSFSHTVYFASYIANPAMSLASFAWPAFALVAALAFAVLWEFPDRRLVIAAEAICIPAIFWEAGTNPPTGPAHDYLVQFLPFGNALLQTYALTLVLLSKLYPVLVAFAVITLGRLAGQFLAPARTPGPSGTPTTVAAWAPPFDSAGTRRSPFGRIVAVGVTIGLVAIVASAAWPIYNGQVERTAWMPDQAGYHIPSSYFAARSTVLATPATGVVVMPGLATYFRTSWGFNGANGFYSNFLYPAKVIVPKYYGAYALYVNTTVENYTIATNPIAPDLSNATVVNATFPMTSVHDVASSTGGVRTTMAPARPIVVGHAAWVRFQFPFVDYPVIDGALNLNSIWIGIQSSGGAPSFYVPGAQSNSYLEAVTNRSMTVDLLLNAPSIGPPFNASTINSIIFWIRSPVPTFRLVGPPIAVDLVPSSTVSTSWLSAMRNLGIGYLWVDETVVSGQAQTDTLVHDSVAELLREGYIYPRNTDPSLGLYVIATG